MMSINLDLNRDYPLEGSILNFEAYMFATTPSHISEHTSFDGQIVIIDGNRHINVMPMAEKDDRKKAMVLFNEYAEKKIPSLPKPKGLACCLIDFMDDQKVYNMSEIWYVYKRLRSVFVSWMNDNDRVAAMVQHFYQGTRVPHVHILYQKKNGAPDSEFQYYCADNL